MNKGAWLDVDGCIRHNDRSKLGGNYYTLSYEDVEWIDGAIEAHRLLYEAGYKIFWVTMQNCIVEGKISRSDCETIFAKMQAHVNSVLGVPAVTDFEVCTAEESSEAKIQAKIEAVNRLAWQNNIDLSESFGCGDAKSDVLAFKGSGFAGKTGMMTVVHIDLPDTTAKNDHDVAEADGIAPNLLAAVQWFLMWGNNPSIIFDSQVNKLTGREYVISNDECHNRCFKLIQIFKGRKSSYHFHETKSESFTVVKGQVRFVVDDEIIIGNLGDTLYMTKGTPHSFEALTDMAVLFEQSTLHDDNDTIRITRSGASDEI